jgi:hypothetical protein
MSRLSLQRVHVREVRDDERDWLRATIEERSLRPTLGSGIKPVSCPVTLLACICGLVEGQAGDAALLHRSVGFELEREWRNYSDASRQQSESARP